MTATSFRAEVSAQQTAVNARLVDIGRAIRLSRFEAAGGFAPAQAHCATELQELCASHPDVAEVVAAIRAAQS